MKHLDTFKKHNESWRQAKAYLRLPHLLIDMGLSKLIKHIPKLNFTYDKLAANIDTGNSYGPGNRIGEFEEIKLSDISDNKVKNSLRLSGLFNNWHIYKLNRLSHDNKTPIYISKDELIENDLIYGERLFKDTDSEFYVIAAKKTKQHDDIRGERNEREKKRIYNKYKKMVDEVEKNKKSLSGRTGINDFNIVFHNLIKNNLIDLIKRSIKLVKDDDKLRRLIISTYEDGHQTSRGTTSLDLAKDKPEILEVLNCTLYDLWLKSKKSR